MTFWESIKFSVEERIPTNDRMFWNTDFWWLFWMPAWPFFISIAITNDFDTWQKALGGITALLLIVWGRLILQLRKQKKANYVVKDRFSDHNEGGF